MDRDTHSTYMDELLGTGGSGPRVHINREGSEQFETGPTGEHGVRTFGFWYPGEVRPGDLFVIFRANHNGAYLIDNAEVSFKGSDDNRFWKGQMRDVVELGLRTPERDRLLVEALERR